MSGKSQRPAAEMAFLIIRGQRVMLDADLAKVFRLSTDGVEKRIRCNRSRFPEDFLFRLTAAERDELIEACPRLRRLRLSRRPPLVFTEAGLLMLASVLEGPTAEVMSVEIIRGYVEARKMAATDGDLAREFDAIESKYDSQFKVVFNAIRGLMRRPDKPGPRIGFGR